MDRRIEWLLAAFNHRQDRLEAQLRWTLQALGEALLDRRLARLSQPDDLVLPGDTAEFLNWADGPGGPAARAGLWFNPAVPAEYTENAVSVLLVNERIVEQPYVFAALGHLPRAARILDVGGSESLMALSLAALGHQIHVVDPRGYPLEHPLLRAHACRLDELSDDLAFDAAVALSSIEHFGLGAYGQSEQDDDRPDRAALADIQDRLRPGGILILTVPCGPNFARDSFQRVYSFGELHGMLTTWELVDVSVAWRLDIRTWVRGRPDEPESDAGVAMVTARKPAG